MLYLLYDVVIVCQCSGVVLIALGIWLLVTLAQSWGPSQVFSLATDSPLYRNSAILLIAMGCFILFVTILGLVAAIMESVVLLGIVSVVYEETSCNYSKAIILDQMQLFYLCPSRRLHSLNC